MEGLGKSKDFQLCFVAATRCPEQMAQKPSQRHSFDRLQYKDTPAERSAEILEPAPVCEPSNNIVP